MSSCWSIIWFQYLYFGLAANGDPGTQISRSHFRELFSFGINITGISFLNFFNRRADDLLIGYYLGPVALGYYSVAYRLLLLILQVDNWSNQPSRTTNFFSPCRQQPERIRSAFYKVTKYTSLVSFPIFFGMAAIAPELVKVVFGEEWLPSVPVMQILACMGIWQSVSIFNAKVIVAMGKPDWQFKFYLITAIVNVVSFLLVVEWGIVAVAAAYTIRAYLFSPIPIYLVKKLINIEFVTYWQQYITPFISSVVMAIAISGLKYLLIEKVNDVETLAICTISGIVFYGTIIFLFAPKLSKEMFSLIRLTLPARS